MKKLLRITCILSAIFACVIDSNNYEIHKVAKDDSYKTSIMRMDPGGTN